MDDDSTETLDGTPREAVRIPVAEERVEISKRVVEGVGARVALRTEAHEVAVSEALRDETVSVDRVPVDRIVFDAPEPRQEDGVTIVPVVEEVLVRAFRVVEEVRLTVEAGTRRHEETVTLRRQTAEVVEGGASDTETNPKEG